MATYVTTKADLRPSVKKRVMDLVREAGVDVSDWRRFKRGAKWAAANPKYAYEWSFLEPGKVAVLSLWWDNLEDESGRIVTSLNSKRAAKRLDWEPVKVRRALAMDKHLQAAAEQGLEIRVIINDGWKRPPKPGSKGSTVRVRELDSMPWRIQRYDRRTGEYRLVRSGTQHSLGSRASRKTASAADRKQSSARSPGVDMAARAQSNWLKTFASAVVEQLRPTTSAIVKYHDASKLNPSSSKDGTGLWIELGNLRSNTAVTPELWLDRYVSEQESHFFFGLGAYRNAKLERIAPHLLVEFGEPRRIDDDDLDKASDTLKRVLRGTDFDTPILSVHDTSNFGLYHGQPYPFSMSAERALLRKVTEFFERSLQCLPSAEPKSSKAEDAATAATVISEGQGLAADAKFRRVLENHAVSRATAHFEGLGYTVQSVGAYESFDLMCQKGAERIFVEAKGTTSTGTHVLLTANEVDLANDRRKTSALFVVSKVRMTRTRTGWHAIGGVNRCLWPWKPKSSRFKPVVYRYSI
jgi:hypothetical protein